MRGNVINYQQLLRINKQLQKKLNEAQIQIISLRQENSQLKQRLATYENQQSTVHIEGQNSDQQEVFTSSSAQNSEQCPGQYQNLNEQIEQIPTKKLNFQQQQPHENPIMTPISITKPVQRVVSHPKVIFNYQSQGSQVPKLLMKQQKRQISKQNSDHSHQSSQNRWGGNVSVQHSAIKFQEPIMAKNNSSIFQRVKNSNKIYDYFFVTGYSFKQNSRVIQYCFPSQSQHFSAILSLIYTQNSLRPFENSSSSGKSPRATNIKYGKLSIKDSFVMIIYKQKNFQRQYLFACEVEDILEAPGHSLYMFNRLFCFITSCSFFSVYKKIIEQFINKINSNIQEIKITSPLSQHNAKQQLTGLLQQHLKILWQKNVKQNQYVNFGLGNQINIFIDVPSASESYRNLLEYRPWGILFCPIYLSYQAQQIKQKELFGFLLTYMLTQTKIMLYSMVKSKVSEAILHALQMIKPLEYVNPIIMATIKDQHQEYFNAPMSVILGLWGEPKQKRKQKIQIFMNKKPSMMSLTSLIEENKANQLDGVIFNLDTGQTCGGGITNEKNRIAIQLNCLIQNSCKSSKQKYKLMQNLLIKRSNFQSQQMKQLSDRLLYQIKNTQLYSFYLQKSNAIMHV